MALNKNKVDSKLGMEIHKHLKKVGVETPFIVNELDNKVELIQDKFKEIMEILGLDLKDDSLIESPKRVAKMYVEEIFWGLNPNYFPKITTVENKMNYDEMVLEKRVNIASNCEHHFVAIDGYASVAYMPNKKVLGLSKLNRVVEYFSKRPQIQERLTEQIYHALSYILETEDVAVVIDAAHLCVKTRGVEDVNSRTITSKLGGAFKKNPDLRSEFMSLIKD